MKKILAISLLFSNLIFAQKTIHVGKINGQTSGATGVVIPFDGNNNNYLGGDTAFHPLPTFTINGNIYSDSLCLTPNLFKGMGYSDVKKIQLALDLAIQKNKRLLISFNEERNSSIWRIDSAILLRSYANIIIQNTILKQTDSCRDNIFRTANCGIGITNPGVNPYSNITIQGIGLARLEGADNPRSTGDAGKSLSLTPNAAIRTVSYGTDFGKAGRSQKGDWRNYGAIIAYSKNVNVSGIQLWYCHAYGISFSRCEQVTIKDIEQNMPGWAADGDRAKVLLNCGGIDFNSHMKDIIVENIRGISADDNVAFNISNLTGVGHSAGDADANYPTGDTTNSVTDSIVNIYVNNVNCKSYDNTIRVLATYNTVAKNINISNVTNSITPDDEQYSAFGNGVYSAILIIGSSNVSYGGPSTLGKVSNFNISNLKSYYTAFGVWVQGSLAESNISNVFLYRPNPSSYLPNPYNPVYADTPSTKLRNVSVMNCFPATGLGLATNLAGTYSANVYSIMSSDNVNRVAITGAGVQKNIINTGSSEAGSVSIGAPFGAPGLIFLNTSGTGRTQIRQYNSSGGLGFGYDATGPSDQMILTSTGLFGVGVLPTEKLEVNGNVKASQFKTATSVFWSSGTGSPESVVTAGIGSVYTRTDGGAGTTLYVKESGTGNTGWIAK